MARTKHGKQTGAALVIGMLFTLVLTILGIAAIQSSSTSVRMARNAEARINGFQQAQAAADYVAAEAIGLNLDRVGSTARCTASYPYGACNAQALPALPAPLVTPPVHVRVRSALALGSSKSEENNKVFERVIESDYDGTTFSADSSQASDTTHVGVVSAVRGTIVSSGSVRYDSETPSPTPNPTGSGGDGSGDQEGEDDGEEGEGLEGNHS